MERDAARKHTEIIAALSQEKTTLEKTIDELRTFERGVSRSLDDLPGLPDPRTSSTLLGVSLRLIEVLV